LREIYFSARVFSKARHFFEPAVPVCGQARIFVYRGRLSSPPPRDFAERKIHKSRNQPEVKEKEREERERKGGKHEETY